MAFLLILLIILSLFWGLAYYLLMGHFTYGWLSLEDFKLRPAKLNTTVSIIIAARNEENNIESCIQSIRLQNYPANLFELIIVDDDSEDQTGAIVREWEKKDPRIRLILPEKKHPINAYKKKALEAGIKMAKGTLIVTTDADCTMGSDWLPTIVSFYEQNQPVMIVSPVVFATEDSAFQQMQSLEMLALVGATAATIKNKMPIMCNGANLAFDKAAFLEVNGYDGINDIASGDDVLLLFKLHQKYPGKIQFLKSKTAVVSTKAEKTWSGFYNQRKRWASKAGKYPLGFVTLVGIIVYGFNALLAIDFMMALLNPPFIFLFLILLVTKSLFDFLLLFPVAGFFEKRKLLVYFLPQQFLNLFYVTIIGIAALDKSYQWKGRKVK